MSTVESWQARNDAFLSAALSWLRLKLEDAARPPREANDAPRDAEIDAAAAKLVEVAEGDSPPALPLLGQRLGLSEFERDVLLLCAAMELDTRTGGLCARAQGDSSRPYPTFALAMAMLDNPAWEALSPERPLRYWRLLEISQLGAQPLTSSTLRADERIVSFVKGLNYLDDRLAPLVVPVERADCEELPPSQRDVASRILEALGPSTEPVSLIALNGRDSESKRSIASSVAASIGLHLYRLPIDSLPAHAADLETLARLWHRESLLLPLALYVDAADIDRSASTGVPDSPLNRLGRFIGRTGGLVFVDSRDGLALPVEDLLSAEVRKPVPVEQRAIWAAALGDRKDDTARWLAGQFDLNARDITSIAARAGRGNGTQSFTDGLWRGCLERTRPVLDKLADKLDAKATWEQLVLQDPEAALLRQIAEQVDRRAKVYDEWGFRSRMNRGYGISALFAGDSGTGKTMAAEVLANALKLDLYRIDLSAVVSKYIGETEKNLRQVFDAAEDGGAILLFDEADALFGKRSEVKDSHDRYSNIEINYLLQRMEAYRGVAILATNMKSALDPAFVRRLRFIINFPFPGLAERRQIWRSVFPADTPLGVFDYERLARLNLTGGNIHSVALNAAFLAAAAGTPVTMKHVLEAGRNEFRKFDRPINEAEMRWVEPQDVVA